MFYQINSFFSVLSIALFSILWIFNCFCDFSAIKSFYLYIQQCVIIFLIRIFYRDKNSSKFSDFFPDFFIVILIILAKNISILPLSIKNLNPELILIAVRQIYVWTKPFQKIRLMQYPERSVVVSYAATIIYGFLLLSLPISWEPGIPVSYIDAFFTSTSASCITGLTSGDISKSF